MVDEEVVLRKKVSVIKDKRALIPTSFLKEMGLSGKTEVYITLHKRGSSYYITVE